MSLLNKFVFISYNDYSQAGQLTAQACDCAYVLKLDPGESPQASVLIEIGAMLANDCFIFDTREEMDAWLEWAERDEGEKVVNLKEVGGKGSSKKTEH